MSLFSANGPEDVTRQQEAPGSEGTPSTEAAAGEEHEAPLRRVPHMGHALVFVAFTGLSADSA